MKHISIFLAALLLSLALTACGDSKQDSGQQDPSNKTETTQPAEETPSDGDASSKDSILSPSDDMTGSDSKDEDREETPMEKAGTSVDRMLRNAQARDSDGILTDGENAVTPGAAR